MATPSPFPIVSQALDPYILPRSSVSSIRQSLHSHLERQLRLEAAQTLSLANITNPPLTQTLPEPPASVTGVRRAYWKALRAHQVARERYEGLRAELDVAARNAGAGAGEFANGDGDEEDEGRDLLPLLRARERRRKLGAIERAVKGVEKEGRDVVGAKIDDVVKRTVGDVPVLPSQRGVIGGGGGGGREEGEMRVVELKKAILAAKATIEGCEREASTDARQNGGRSELLALQQARNELINWIETQLALIGDAQAEESDPTSSPIKPNGDDQPTHIATPEEISQLYDRYLSARRTLLSTVQQPPSASPLAEVPESPKPARSSQHTDQSTTASTTLLPHILPLLSTHSAEISLHHQSAYVRRQLSTAESSTDKLLRRFADESHLVHPGALRGRDWARAGEEVGEATRECVLARAKAGEKASTEAGEMLRRTEGVSGGLERLVTAG